MRLSFNPKFYRNWPFWVGVIFLLGDWGLRIAGIFTSDPLGVMIGIVWLVIGVLLPIGSD
ncbi:hypothetical protein [Levilactobacillus suantsaii]|uniref:Uncharacterized protein n=1 Tax=Levilactobacillus suantsaii TaxID=2292255 RepID=A0A4Q0VH37_9LACO|nr:hypothetical protein [Levilactobacillus suantsaii]QMU08986.1 hypothetical protein H3M12_04905 [Levilactobacillus suantsaii]RXI77982.1 hypothetical protein DXH47_08240 [Levilactobacillus suantsaii]